MLYAPFLKKFSILPGKALNLLKVHPAKDFQLPLDSALHYIDMDSPELGIRGSHPMIVNFPKDVRVFHETELPITKGKAIRKKQNYKKMESVYFRSQGRVRRARDIGKALDSRRNLVVYDYSFLTHGIDYSDHILTPYYEWSNINDMFLKGIKITTEERETFSLYRLPNVLPAFADFKMITEELSNTHATKWHTFEALGLRDLWLFIEGKGSLSTLSEEQLKQLNFVFMGAGFVSVIPALQFRFNEDDKDSVETRQKHFYQVLEKFVEQKSLVETAALEVEKETEQAADGAVSPKILKMVSELGSEGQLSSREQAKIIELAKATESIPDPITGKPIGEASKVEFKETVVSRTIPTAIDKIIDPTIKESSVSNFDKHYQDNIMFRDINNMFLKLKDAGVIVRDVQMEEIVDALDSQLEYTVKVQPITGKSSTIKFQIPKLDDQGRFFKGGVKYTFDSQRVDMPIRKSGPDKVALTSYYGKTFIKRSPKAVDNYGRWLLKHINAAGLDVSNKAITALRYGDMTKIEAKVPLAYSSIGSKLEGFTSNKFVFNFAYDKREELYGKDVLKKLEKDGVVVCATNSSGEFLTINMDNALTLHSKGNSESKGRLESFILPEAGTAPRDHIVMSVFNKQVPIVMVLSYLLGFEKLLKYLKVNYRIVATGSREPIEANEIAVKFKDETVIIDASRSEISMLYAGFRPVRKAIHTLRMDQLNRKEGYGPLMTFLGGSNYHLNELELLEDMFIDPITEEILKSKDQPTVYKELLLYAVELLQDDRHPDETDPEFMRIRGIERFSGTLYRRLVEGVRGHRNNQFTKTATIDVNPMAVMGDIQNDQTTIPASSLNPISSLKEQETVNLGGAGGRSAETLVKRSRIFHKNDLGLISEGTPDSAKVGIRSILSPNANIDTVRGVSSRYKEGQGSSSVLSTTGLLMPGTNHDDKLKLVS